jgi:hypothetical protein
MPTSDRPQFGSRVSRDEERGYVCPGCRSWQFVTVVVGDERRHVCVECGSCWALRPGSAQRVDPVACDGCGREATCFERLRRVIPAFTWDPAGPTAH